jgi:hypothetical protein
VQSASGPKSAWISVDGFKMQFRIAEEKGLLRGGRTLMVRGRMPVALVARKAKDRHFLRFKIAGSRARQHCRTD